MQSLTRLTRDVAMGRVRAEDVLQRARQAILDRDPPLGSFVSVAPEPAWQAGIGPLRGMAVGLKDIIDTADLPTEMGCPSIWGGWRPRADAAVVGQILAAGGTIAGKTASTALAHMDPAPTLNPHDVSRTPGGSSAGSAAAVAAGLVPLAIGTQTAGSVIRPAAFCGVAAIKPSFRLIPTSGIKVQAWTLDTVGLFAATVADCALALAAISGRDVDLRDDDPSRPTIGIVSQDFAGPADPEAMESLEAARRAMVDVGWTAKAMRIPDIVADGWAAQPLVQAFEMKTAFEWEWRCRRDDLPPRLRSALEAAQSVDVPSYDAARGRARRARTAARSLFSDAGVDALVTVSAPGVAPSRDTTGDPRFNRLWTLLGVPCVNVPGLRTAGGLPLGLQVIAPFAKDRLALAVARMLETLLTGHPDLGEAIA